MRVKLPGELLKERIGKERKGNVGVDQKSQAQFSDNLDSSARHGAVLQAPSLGPFRFIGGRVCVGALTALEDPVGSTLVNNGQARDVTFTYLRRWSAAELVAAAAKNSGWPFASHKRQAQ